MFAAQSVFTQFAGSKSKGVEAASAGLGTFAAVSLAIPHPVGLALGAVAGLTAGFVSYGKAMGEAIEGSDKFREAIEKVSKMRFGFTEQKTLAGLVSGTSLGLDRLKIEADEAAEMLKITVGRIAELKEKDRFGFRTPKDTAELAKQEALAESQAKLALAKRRDLAAAEAVKDREALASANKILLEGTKIQLQAGLIDPIEALRVEASAASTELQKLLSQGANVDGTALGLAIDKARGAQSKLDSQKRLEGLADGFGTAVSRSLGDAILSGKKPMAALADLGGSLFENAIGKAMEQVQTGMAAAMKAIAGGSDIAGGAITAALGVGGALLAKRASGVDQSFSSIRSIVESSAAVRGIVAGPSSVAINTVGESLTRSMVPVTERLDRLISVAAMIEANTRAGRRQPMDPLPRRGDSIANTLATT